MECLGLLGLALLPSEKHLWLIPGSVTHGNESHSNSPTDRILSVAESVWFCYFSVVKVTMGNNSGICAIIQLLPMSSLRLTRLSTSVKDVAL